jgi:hypothetical protein
MNGDKLSQMTVRKDLAHCFTTEKLFFTSMWITEYRAGYPSGKFSIFLGLITQEGVASIQETIQMWKNICTIV